MKVEIPWNTAPEWANWAAMDIDGHWFWYENKPKFYEADWGGCRMRLVEFPKKTAKSTLTKRPRDKQ